MTTGGTRAPRGTLDRRPPLLRSGISTRAPGPRRSSRPATDTRWPCLDERRANQRGTQPALNRLDTQPNEKASGPAENTSATTPPIPARRTPRQSPQAVQDSAAASTRTIESDWLADQLLDQRIVSLSGRLTPETTNRAAASLALLDASGDDPIQLRLHDLRPDPNAQLGAVLTMLDTIDLVTVPIHTTCLGGLTGTLAVLLAVADQRIAGANAHIILRGPRIDLTSSSAAELETHARQARHQLGTLQQRLADPCQRPVQAVIDDMRIRRVLTAEQARGYGLVDHLTSSHTPTAPAAINSTNTPDTTPENDGRRGPEPVARPGSRRSRPHPPASSPLRLSRAFEPDMPARHTAADSITMVEAGRNPGRIMTSVSRRFADAHPTRHVRAPDVRGFLPCGQCGCGVYRGHGTSMGQGRFGREGSSSLLKLLA
jgi:ATP-dependent Clp protease, protease subunit